MCKLRNHLLFLSGHLSLRGQEERLESHSSSSSTCFSFFFLNSHLSPPAQIHIPQGFVVKSEPPPGSPERFGTPAWFPFHFPCHFQELNCPASPWHLLPAAKRARVTGGMEEAGRTPASCLLQDAYRALGTRLHYNPDSHPAGSDHL